MKRTNKRTLAAISREERKRDIKPAKERKTRYCRPRPKITFDRYLPWEHDNAPN